MAEVEPDSVPEVENGNRDAGKDEASHVLPPDLSTVPEDANTIFGAVTKTPLGPIELDVKDFPGSENIIPLSPQWLFTKHGDGKPPMTPIDLPQTSVSSSNGGGSDSVSKERWKLDNNRDSDKRRDWWRTMATEADGGAGIRRDRWREDERESSLLGRRDRWKEGGDATDGRRADRRAENLSNARDLVDNRRAPLSERRSESASRETNYEGRRDSKWNTRWGPEDKDKEAAREKRPEFEKEGEGNRDRQHTSNNRNENEREADQPARDRWRPHSITIRGKGEVPPLSSTPSKTAPGFGAGRGRGDSTPTGFAVGRGRANFAGSGPLHGAFSPIGSSSFMDRSDTSPLFRYPRAKLLDIYRKCSSSFPNRMLPEGFTEAPQLTQAEPLEPLAFFTPDMDEEAVLEGILKGDVLTSGAVHAGTKDQNGKTRENIGWNRARGRSIGNKEDAASEVTREDNLSSGITVLCQDMRTLSVKHSESINKTDRDEKRQLEGKNKWNNEAELSQQVASIDNVLRVFSDKEVILTPKSEKRPGEKRYEEHHGGVILGGCHDDDDKKEVLNKLTALGLDESPVKGQNSNFGDRKDSSSTQITPEELSLFYIDPKGKVQGPFLGAEIIDWFKAGFFGTDLLVRTADSPEGTVFSPLSKVMPHLLTNSQVSGGWEDTGELGYHQENRAKAAKDAQPSKFFQHVSPDPVSQMGSDQQYELQSSVARATPTGGIGNISAEEGQLFHRGTADGQTDAFIEKLLEREKTSGTNAEAGLLKRVSSLPQRKAGAPYLQREDLQSLLSQQWPESGNSLQQVPGLIPRTLGHAANRQDLLQEAQEAFLPPIASLDRSRSDLSHQLASQGLDAFHLHQSQQLEKYRIQQQLELGVPLPQILQQQQQAQLSGVLRQQQLADQLVIPGQSHELNLHALQQLAGTRVPPRQLQQQHSFPMQAAELPLDQLLRLQHQASSQVYLEQALRQHQQFPVAEQLHGSPILSERQLHRSQESSRMDMQEQQMEQLLQRHSHELLLQRQQEQQMEQLLQRHSHELLLQRQQEHHARQHAYLLHQQLSNLNDHRVSGVWEVDEFGQFVQSGDSASIPHENFHHPQLQRQPSFPSVHHPAALHNMGVPGALGSQPRLSRSELRRLADLEVQRNLSSLLEGASSMPTDKLAQLQGEIARFEAQNLSLADQVPFEVQALRNQKLQTLEESEGEAGAGGAWDMSRDMDRQVREMLLSRKNEVPVSNWQQNVKAWAKSQAANAQENLESVSRSQRRAEKLSDHLTAEDLSRVLGSHSNFQAQRGSSPGIAFHEQLANSNLWAGEQAKLKPWGVDWPRADAKLRSVNSSDLSGVAGEVRAATLLHKDGGDITDFIDPRSGKKQPFRSKGDEAASLSVPISEADVALVASADMKDALSSISGDLYKAKADEASSQVPMWSGDLNKQGKAGNLLKEFQEVERKTRIDQEGLPLGLQQMQAGMGTMPSSTNAAVWPRAASPALPQSSTPFPRNSAMRSSTQGDDEESFWDYNNTENFKLLARADRLDKFSISRRDQRAQGPFMSDKEILPLQSFSGATAQNASTLSGFSTAVSKPVQANVKAMPALKQQDAPALSTQSSLTVADAKAFREWCEEQINMRREHESTEFAKGHPTAESLKAEFLLQKQSTGPEAGHATLLTDRGVAEHADMEQRTPAKPKKGSEGEEEPDSEIGQSSAAKIAKKKAKKGKKVVDPSLLGFSVASNRILMGEIQHMDD